MDYSGLNDKQVIESRKKYGANVIQSDKTNSFIKLFIESLGDPIIKILLIALSIKIVFLFRNFDWFETLGILIAVFLASFISSISEYGSEKAFNRLQEESLNLKAKVKRNNIVTEIYANEIVKNDIVLIQTGDKVPADGVIIKGSVSVDESSINGESKEVYKESIGKNILPKNRLFKGTKVYSGDALLKITEVGENTFYGQIAHELKEKTSESPLKIRLRNLAKVISTFGYIGAFLASFSYLFSVIVVDNNFVLSDILNTVTNFKVMLEYIIYALTLSVTIIIVSVPEGLPMMITLVLSSNMRRMLKNNVLVRKLIGIETAGNINILFSDKTGTLTKGILKCSRIIDGNLNEYKNEDDIKSKDYEKILKTSMIVNNMSSYYEDKIIGGNSTDRCLLSFFKPCYYDNIKIIKRIPFDSNKKYMITVIDDKTCKNLIKGAPEIIIDNCNYCYDEKGKKVIFKNKKQIINKIMEATKSGIRVICLATSNNYTEDLFNNLIFVGLVFIEDEIRKEAYHGIKLVSDAGIQTVMITGDNKETSVFIAKKLGLIKSNNDIVLTSDELNKLSDIELKKLIPNLRVVARSLPQDKSRLVRVSQELNLVVGMTGDGVNDAPALKKADVGFAFGNGSEVSKDASDIVILDSNFLSISRAILFGRTIFKSIRKFIIFQLTVNLCALSISIIGPFIGIDMPITVIQMLWVNMVMDTLAGLAFSFEPPLEEYMLEKPKKKDENILNSYMYNEILITGIYTTIVCILFLKLPIIINNFTNYNSFITGFFGLFIFLSIFNCFNAHTSRINIFANLIKNKVFIVIILFIFIVQIIMMYFGGALFRTVPLNLKEFIMVLLISSSVIPFDMLRKKVFKRKMKQQGV